MHSSVLSKLVIASLCVLCIAALVPAAHADGITLGGTIVNSIQIQGMGPGTNSVRIAMGDCAQTTANPCIVSGLASGLGNPASIYTLSTPPENQLILTWVNRTTTIIGGTSHDFDNYILANPNDKLSFAWGSLLTGTLGFMKGTQEVVYNGALYPSIHLQGTLFNLGGSLAGGFAGGASTLEISVGGNQVIAYVSKDNPGILNTWNTYSDGYVAGGKIQKVPEPSSLTLIGAGLVAFAMILGLHKVSR